ncbi:MAG: hypothetical protein HC937_02935 [Aquincola sp.]|nr:hypothetical protein [Aquincola sp.]
MTQAVVGQRQQHEQEDLVVAEAFTVHAGGDQDADQVVVRPATALVHEAYVRLVDVDHPQLFNSRRHFLRQPPRRCGESLSITHAKREPNKRGGGLSKLNVDDIDLISSRHRTSCWLSMRH